MCATGLAVIGQCSGFSDFSLNGSGCGSLGWPFAVSCTPAPKQHGHATIGRGPIAGSLAGFGMLPVPAHAGQSTRMISPVLKGGVPVFTSGKCRFLCERRYVRVRFGGYSLLLLALCAQPGTPFTSRRPVVSSSLRRVFRSPQTPVLKRKKAFDLPIHADEPIERLLATPCGDSNF